MKKTTKDLQTALHIALNGEDAASAPFPGEQFDVFAGDEDSIYINCKVWDADQKDAVHQILKDAGMKAKPVKGAAGFRVDIIED